jgi:hypothetical protein
LTEKPKIGADGELEANILFTEEKLIRSLGSYCYSAKQHLDRFRADGYCSCTGIGD